MVYIKSDITAVTVQTLKRRDKAFMLNTPCVFVSVARIVTREFQKALNSTYTWRKQQSCVALIFILQLLVLLSGFLWQVIFEIVGTELKNGKSLAHAGACHAVGLRHAVHRRLLFTTDAVGEGVRGFQLYRPPILEYVSAAIARRRRLTHARRWRAALVFWGGPGHYFLVRRSCATYQNRDVWCQATIKWWEVAARNVDVFGRGGGGRSCHSSITFTLPNVKDPRNACG